MKQALITEIEITGSDLLETATVFRQEDMDKIPFEGSWTAGQVMEHISKAVSAGMLYGDAKAAGRQAGEKTGMIKGIFLDFDTRMQSPPFIEPTENQHDKATYLTLFKQTFKAFAEAVNTLDVTKIPAGIVLPGFGKLTRLELIYLMVYHTQRHTRQLKNMAVKLGYTA